ncbi:MAG: hypothetical protein F4Z28_04190 [Gammaproteobacteria bacterium]|nr:hypothetical protein [Gammaproteobacteria bacterium]
MTQYADERPRVAAIGLDEAQEASIEHLCGTFRSASSVSDYRNRYSWNETDITVLGHVWPPGSVVSGHLLAVGISLPYVWQGNGPAPTGNQRALSSKADNTERELSIPEGCPERYRHLASGLATQLRLLEDPPPTFVVNRTEDDSALVETTSGRPVALRCVINNVYELIKSRPPIQISTIALAIPEVTDLAAWFQAFLDDVHELNPGRVPHPPTRFSSSSAWYTPEEREWAQRIVEIQTGLERLQNRHEQAEAGLAAARERANAGIRRCLWADGDDLEEAIGDILKELGFKVRHMDSETKPGEPKREDLRLTIPDRAGWEAIAEVKGYPAGTRTNDARQIREHRDRYISQEARQPDLTLWISNTYKSVEDPSARPSPGNDVDQRAADIGAVHVLAADLYRLWALVQAGSLEQAQALQHLIDAAPGLWSPPASDTGTRGVSACG